MLNVVYGLGLHDKPLRASRAPQYHLFTSTSIPGVLDQLVFITDKGNFLVEPRFRSCVSYQVINAVWVDFANQTVRRCQSNFPLKLEPEKEYNFA